MMDKIFKFAVGVCVLVIVAAVVGGITEGMKNGRLVRSVTAVIVITVIVGFISDIDFDIGQPFNAESYAVDEDGVWSGALDMTERELEKQLKSYCDSKSLLVDDIDVKLKTDFQKIEVESVEIAGRDAQNAKNLIAGHFQIGLAYIHINGA